jgi:sigma-B regulation protein RsbU (phosphoserine phosphatase)
MARIALKHLLGPRQGGAALVAALEAAAQAPMGIEDADGRLLHGRAAPDGGRYPITLDGTPLGWVTGPGQAKAVAALLDHLVSREAERKALGAEVLHLYREVNLIYAFSEKLAALLDLERVASLTLQEARHLITASDGAIMLLDEQTGELTTLAAFGAVLPGLSGLRRGAGIIGSVVERGNAEIVNEVDADPRRIRDRAGLHSLVCAPLRVGERVIGCIALGTVTPAAYTAAELKLLNTLALQTATAIENARLFERTVQAARERERLLALHQQAELARAKLEGELELAARIQADLFPAVLPDIAGYDVAARNRPARQCGGDYYDVLAVDAGAVTGRLLFCVADVSGKGLPAALLMSNMQATLRALVNRSPALTRLAEDANALLYASTPPNKYVTAALLELQPATGAATYVSAGHVDSLLLRANGVAERLESTGTPLGLMPSGLPYEARTATIAAGDRLVLFSDGVADAQNAAGDEFGEERLESILRESAGLDAAATVGRVFNAIDDFARGAPQFDDITLLVLRRG